MSYYLQLTFPGIEPEQQDILIAQLAEAGFEGFEETDVELRAYIRNEELDRRLLKEICFKYQLAYTETIIESQNWNSVWESGFEPVLVDHFLAIRADFHAPVAGVEQEIIITPKMSFGTGHHATTYLMVQQMKGIDFRGKRVFDFGTGTGILAILAEKLGAERVVAIDNDDWSIANAAENFERNQCRRISLQQAANPMGPDPYDIILANINKNVITENLGRLTGSLRETGTLLLCGLLEDDEADILSLTGGQGLSFQEKTSRNGWICLRFKR